MSICAECGQAVPEPEPVIIEEQPDIEPVAEASVEVARIEADRDVTIAKIEHRALDEELIARIAALEAANEALRAEAAPPEPDAMPVEIIEAPAAPEEPAALDSAPPEVETPSTPAEPAKKRRSAWWG